MENIEKHLKKKPKIALDAQRDKEMLRSLQLNAIEQRMQILKLGHDLEIRLHYGAIMSSIEILTTLYLYWMEYKPDVPNWPLRDRFILSKGHAAPGLYVILASCGFFPKQEFANFRKIGSILQGHPDRTKTPGIDCTTGSLGQGFPVACGMALAAKIDKSPYHVYTLLGDGECNEGSIWEAALIASNLGLSNIVALIDRNRQSSYGPMENRNDIEPLAEKWRAFGWVVEECDGHDFVSITNALASVEEDQKVPAAIICHTIKGKGIPWAEKQSRLPSNFFLDEEYYMEAMAYLQTLKQEI